MIFNNKKRKLKVWNFGLVNVQLCEKSICMHRFVRIFNPIKTKKQTFKPIKMFR